MPKKVSKKRVSLKKRNVRKSLKKQGNLSNLKKNNRSRKLSRSRRFRPNERKTQKKRYVKKTNMKGGKRTKKVNKGGKNLKKIVMRGGADFTDETLHNFTTSLNTPGDPYYGGGVFLGINKMSKVTKMGVVPESIPGVESAEEALAASTDEPAQRVQSSNTLDCTCHACKNYAPAIQKLIDDKILIKEHHTLKLESQGRSAIGDRTDGGYLGWHITGTNFIKYIKEVYGNGHTTYNNQRSGFTNDDGKHETTMITQSYRKKYIDDTDWDHICFKFVSTENYMFYNGYPEAQEPLNSDTFEAAIKMGSVADPFSTVGKHNKIFHDMQDELFLHLNYLAQLDNIGIKDDTCCYCASAPASTIEHTRGAVQVMLYVGELWGYYCGIPMCSRCQFGRTSKFCDSVLLVPAGAQTQIFILQSEPWNDDTTGHVKGKNGTGRKFRYELFDKSNNCHKMILLRCLIRNYECLVSRYDVHSKLYNYKAGNWRRNIFINKQKNINFLKALHTIRLIDYFFSSTNGSFPVRAHQKIYDLLKRILEDEDTYKLLIEMEAVMRSNENSSGNAANIMNRQHQTFILLHQIVKDETNFKRFITAFNRNEIIEELKLEFDENIKQELEQYMGINDSINWGSDDGAESRNTNVSQLLSCGELRDGSLDYGISTLISNLIHVVGGNDDYWYKFNVEYINSICIYGVINNIKWFKNYNDSPQNVHDGIDYYVLIKTYLMTAAEDPGEFFIVEDGKPAENEEFRQKVIEKYITEKNEKKKKAVAARDRTLAKAKQFPPVTIKPNVLSGQMKPPRKEGHPPAHRQSISKIAKTLGALP